MITHTVHRHRIHPADRTIVLSGGALPPLWALRWAAGDHRQVAVDPPIARGALPRHPGPGRTLDAVARCASVAQVLLLPEAGTAPPHRLVVAVQDLPGDEPVICAAAEAAGTLGCSAQVLHAVPRAFGERSVGLPEAVEGGRQLLADGAALFGAQASIPVSTSLVRAWPHEVVGELLEADLLVVGGPRYGCPPRLGPIASTAVLHAPCPVLLVPRDP